jgi:hypothetical protein
MAKLTKASRIKEKRNTIYCGDLGHYIADGHMPLHTDNHDGQNTNQKRNSPLWESRLSCLQDYKFNVPQGVYLEMWRATYLILITQFSRAITSIDKIKNATPENKIFVTDAVGEIVKNKWRNPLLMNMLNNCMQI